MPRAPPSPRSRRPRASPALTCPSRSRSHKRSPAATLWRRITTRNGSTDFGLFQVNSIHAAILASGDWRDPAANARMAFAVWQTSGWRAWTTYRTGAYLKFMAGCSAPPAGGPAASPLTPGNYTITSTFGPRWGTLHAGIDLAAPALTLIYAALPGVVVQASDTGNGYGQEVLIRTGNVDILYAHQSIGAIVVTVGQAVTAGQRIGGVGTTGDSTGNHCHFEIRVNGTPVDRVPFMAARGVRIA